MNSIEVFPDREGLAAAAAEVLAQTLSAPDARSLVATGGTTPGPAYDRLATADLDWRRITVTPSDERWVATDSVESNERLLRQRLLVDRAAAALFLPLKGRGGSPREDAAAVEPRLRELLPFTAVLLGMGEDGHIGSLFPTSPDLDATLDPAGGPLCIGVAMSGEKPFLPRISLTVRAFLDTRLLVLLISGQAKRDLVDRVRADPGFAPPVAAVLRQNRAPVRLMWAP
ncbi:MAG TPA: 6-phosphogluconolactonase [Caulobacteraceae bacterium]